MMGTSFRTTPGGREAAVREGRATAQDIADWLHVGDITEEEATAFRRRLGITD